MNPIDQLFNFVECCEHAPVNLHPYFSLMFIEMGIMAAFLHAVYRGNDFYAQVLLLYKSIPPSGYEREALVASTSSAPWPPTRKSSSSTRMTTTTGLLGTSLIDLKRSTFNI